MPLFFCARSRSARLKRGLSYPLGDQLKNQKPPESLDRPLRATADPLA